MARIIQEAEEYDRESSHESAGGRHSIEPLGHVHARRSSPWRAASRTLDSEAALEVPDMVSASAVYAAEQLGVVRIVAFSQSGFTARLVARYRPQSLRSSPSRRTSGWRASSSSSGACARSWPSSEVGSLDDIVRSSSASSWKRTW